MKNSSRNNSNDTTSFFDLWKEEKDERPQEIQDLELDQKTRLGKNKVKVPKRLRQKPTLISAVEVPLPGASYNPSFEDHQKLLQKALDIELQKKEEEDRLKRTVGRYRRKMNEEIAQKEWLKEMSQGLDDYSENDMEETEPACEPLIRNPPVRAENRKTRAQRNRELRAKLMQENRMKSKEFNIKESKVYKLRSYMKEIKLEGFKSELRQKKREEVNKQKMYEPKRIGPNKFEDPDLEFNFSTEITGSLRTVKTDGNLLKDRFLSFQKRSLIEPRKLSLKKQKKSWTKSYTKRGHEIQ